jgi:hypothetical protein
MVHSFASGPTFFRVEVAVVSILHDGEGEVPILRAVRGGCVCVSVFASVCQCVSVCVAGERNAVARRRAAVNGLEVWWGRGRDQKFKRH